MQTATIFFCDIRGTIDGKIANSIFDYKIFFDTILQLKDLYNSDKIIFSLVSSDDELFVSKKANYLMHYNKNDIVFGKQFFLDGYIDNQKSFKGTQGKTAQITSYLNELEKTYHIDNVIYADDCIIFHDFLIEIFKALNMKNKLVSIIPTEDKGLSELNQLLQNHILINNKKIKILGHENFDAI